MNSKLSPAASAIKLTMPFLTFSPISWLKASINLILFCTSNLHYIFTLDSICIVIIDIIDTFNYLIEE